MHNHKGILCLSLAGMMVLGTPTHSFAASTTSVSINPENQFQTFKGGVHRFPGGVMQSVIGMIPRNRMKS